MTVLIRYKDCCTFDHLNDHHLRDGETLLGVSVTNGTTYQDLKDGLLEAFNDADDISEDDVATEDFVSALDEMYAECGNMAARAFVDVLSDMSAWFVVLWKEVD